MIYVQLKSKPRFRCPKATLCNAKLLHLDNRTGQNPVALTKYFRSTISSLKNGIDHVAVTAFSISTIVNQLHHYGIFHLKAQCCGVGLQRIDHNLNYA